VVDGAALEKRWAMSLVGSNPTLSARLFLFWRGAGVDDQARLESACRCKVTVGSNPTLSAKIFTLSTYFAKIISGAITQ
jgi:hypothetical protein